MEWIDRLKQDGFTRTRFTLNFSDGTVVDFNYAYIEQQLPDDYVALFRQMKDLGIQARFSLSFWDMIYKQAGGTISKDRLSTEAEKQRYLDYVRMVVTRLKGLVDAYELWNEPDANYDLYQRIRVEDYMEIARLAIPLIREIDPQAKVILVCTSNFVEQLVQAYSMTVLQSEIVSLADGISLHTVNNDASPEFLSEYYYNYESMWNNIKETAESHGFNGEYIADELNYRSAHSLDIQPENGDYHPYLPEVAAKYLGRMIAINLGMDISLGTSGTNIFERPKEGAMIRSMAYLLDGLHAYKFPIVVNSQADQIRYYSFIDNGGDIYIAIWNDGPAQVVGQFFSSSIAIQGYYGSSVTSLDPYVSTMQSIHFTNENNSILISDLTITDYPIIIRIGIR